MDRLEFLRHIKKLVILAIFSDDELMDRLVLKGGNLLDIVYQLSARASVDVDLSMAGEFEDVKRLHDKVLHALEVTFAPFGYIVFDFRLTEQPPKLSDDMKDFWGGYCVELKLIDELKRQSIADDIDSVRRNAEVVGDKGSTVFKIDISKHEFCDDKQLFQLDDHSVYGYSPEMFVAEKLRAICQQMDEYVELVRLHPRPRPKDFVDIQIISQHYGIDFSRDDFRDLVSKTFAIKKVSLKLLGELDTSRDFHAVGYEAVQSTVYAHFDLQEFDFYFEYVCRKCEQLEPLWRK
jgi:Nucleotidyl transferase AbiEii toxin, Type IV TA system